MNIIILFCWRNILCGQIFKLIKKRDIFVLSVISLFTAKQNNYYTSKVLIS